MKKSTKSSDIRGGIALALTTFIISIYLYFQSGYFGSWTNAVAIFLIAIGLAGFGIELEKLTSRKLDALIDKKKGSGIFDNLGIGLAMFVVWAALHHYFPMVWVNVLTFVLLLFSVYGMALGLINILFRVIPRPRGKSGVSGVDSKDEASLPQNEMNKPQPLAAKIAVITSGIIGFIASIIQILQFLKVIP